jgi:hypothetical protein
MSLWVFLLWMALGIVLAVFLARYIPLRRPARARLKLRLTRHQRLRYLQPYAPTPPPAPAASEKGPACD